MPPKPVRATSWGWDGDGTATAPPTNFSPTFSPAPTHIAEMWFPPHSVARTRGLPGSYKTSDLGEAWEQHILSIGERVMDVSEKVKKVGVQRVKWRVARIEESDYDDDRDGDEELVTQHLEEVIHRGRSLAWRAVLVPRRRLAWRCLEETRRPPSGRWHLPRHLDSLAAAAITTPTPGLSRPCRHRRVGIATRGRESKRCIGESLGAGNMRIPICGCETNRLPSVTLVVRIDLESGNYILTQNRHVTKKKY
jgi:hypothetical protein